MRGWGLHAALVAALGMSAPGCSSDADSKGNGKPDAGSAPLLKDCSGKSCAVNAAAVEWQNKGPTFAAHVRVMDERGSALQGARVIVGDKQAMTDESGFAKLGQVPASRTQAVTARMDGFTPAASRTSVSVSHRQRQELQLLSIGVEREVRPASRTVMEHRGGMLDVQARGLVKLDGSRPERARGQMTQMDGDMLRASGLAAIREAVDEAGRPAMMEELLAATYVHFKAEDGSEMNLANGQTATLTVRLPSESRFRKGDEVAMWSLDERSNTWRKERTCRVDTRGRGDDQHTVCTGILSHFSFWGIGRQVDIYEPGSLGCVNFAIQPPEGVCYTVSTHRMSFVDCATDGSDCDAVVPPGYDYTYYAAGRLNQCAVTPANATRRMLLVYAVDTAKCDAARDENIPVAGRRLWLSDPIELGTSFQERLGSELITNFTLKPEDDCASDELCVQKELEMTPEILAQARFVDFDEDGYFVQVPASETPDGGVADAAVKQPMALDDWFKTQRDCDDASGSVHPRAYESVCAEQDTNCDGEVFELKSDAKYTDVAPLIWNYECECLAKRLDSTPSKEVEGNAYDDDCDGFVADLDGDGFPAFNPNLSWGDQPQDALDCNDWVDSANPEGSEVPGDYIDENCDGAALDRDGDGTPASIHAWVTDRGGFAIEDFTDCDDLRASRNAGVDPKQEVGQAEIFYYVEGEDWRRIASYCSFYDEDGSLSKDAYGRPLLSRLVEDYSCDGFVTDADGDGFTVPGDTSLGEGLDIDCDDMDPRVGAGSLDSEGELVCDTDPAGLVNDSSCNANTLLYTPGVTCPSVPADGGEVASVCTQSIDPDGNPTGSSACAFLGWNESNPISFEPGTLWGPCDGQAGDRAKALVDCPEGSVCGGDANGSAWTPEFTTYIQDRYASGAELGFFGMCFPVCTP